MIFSVCVCLQTFAFFRMRRNFWFVHQSHLPREVTPHLQIVSDAFFSVIGSRADNLSAAAEIQGHYRCLQKLEGQHPELQ